MLFPACALLALVPTYFANQLPSGWLDWLFRWETIVSAQGVFVAAVLSCLFAQFLFFGVLTEKVLKTM